MSIIRCLPLSLLIWGAMPLSAAETSPSASPELEEITALWGKNLANRVWISHVYTIANEVFGVYGEPRMYGLRLTWHFAP